MATEMLNLNVPIPVVSGRLAHARASTTLDVYAHAVPAGDRHAANLLNHLITTDTPAHADNAITPARPGRHPARPHRSTSTRQLQPSLPTTGLITNPDRRSGPISGQHPNDSCAA
jgi:hypothetical protein